MCPTLKIIVSNDSANNAIISSVLALGCEASASAASRKMLFSTMSNNFIIATMSLELFA